jgi:hypothetical protein
MVHGLARLSGAAAESIPVSDAARAARAQCRRWKLDPDRLRVETHDPPSGPCVLPLEIPADIRVLLGEDGGFEGLRGVFRALGEALHHAHITTRRHYLQQESPVLLFATARIFEGVLREEGWLHRHLKAPAAVIRNHLRAERYMRLLEIRRQMAAITFENLVYAQADIEPQRLYLDVAEQILQETRRPEIIWPALGAWTTMPLEPYWELRAEMVAAHLRSHLRSVFPEPWHDERVGEWLRDHLFAPGLSLAEDEKVVAATGSRPGLDALVRELALSFAGPTLDEEEEGSDEAGDESRRDMGGDDSD